MKTKHTLLSMLIAAVCAINVPAYAVNDGHLQDIWFSTQFKTTIKKNHGLTSQTHPYLLTTKDIKFDSGAGRCFSGTSWGGTWSYYYRLISVCGSGATWRHASTYYINELADGGLGVRFGDNGAFYDFQLPAAGQSTANNTPREVAVYGGGLFFKPIFAKDGTVTKLTPIQPQDGVIAYFKYNNEDGIIAAGSGRAGLTMKQINKSSVPAEAIACFEKVADDSEETVCDK